MTTHRRYYFAEPGPWEHGGHEKVLTYLRQECEQHWWFNEPTVEGAPYNRLSFSFTVSGRDQWWVHVRAMKLAEDVYWHVLSRPKARIPTPAWETLEGDRHQVPASPWGG